MECTLEIDGHGALQQLRWHVEEGVEGTDAGIGRQNVDATEGFHRGIDQCSRRGGFAYVALYGHASAPKGLDFGDHGVDGRGFAIATIVLAEVAEHHVRALPRELGHDGAADTA